MVTTTNTRNILATIEARFAHCPVGEPITIVSMALALDIVTPEAANIARTPEGHDAWFRDMTETMFLQGQSGLHTHAERVTFQRQIDGYQTRRRNLFTSRGAAANG